jgi:two-component system sensor histidine kinase DegS
VNKTAPPSNVMSTDEIEPGRRSVAPEEVPDLEEILGTVEPGPTAAVGPGVRVEGDRPWVSSQFWIVQLIVLALYLIRLAVTVDFHLAATSVGLEFSTFVLFVVPVVYAALHYGFRGAMLTSGWVTVLALPRFFVAAGNHQYDAAWAEVTQVVVLDALALLIGQHVTDERDARRQAEAAREAHLSAEALYRDLFDSNQAPILIVDGSGNVVEANASAQRAFRPDDTGTVPRGEMGAKPVVPLRLVDMIGAGAAAQILTRLIAEQVPETRESPDAPAPDERVEPVVFEIEGHSVLFRPTATMLSRTDGATRMQVVFEDVTAETRRHDRMEAYASRVVLGQEEERRHLAQELHDGPVQTLIHLCRQIDAVDRSTELPPESIGVLSDLRVIAEGTVAELRSIARGLRPSILDDLGLVASINQLVQEAGERQRFATSFGVTGDERRMPAQVELALFRIGQEAITNVEHHARAGRLAVGLSFEASGTRLLVTDDGVGFQVHDRAVTSRSGSLGLPGMTERAHLIGSRLVIHSVIGGGTTVEVWVPSTIIDPD